MVHSCTQAKKKQQPPLIFAPETTRWKPENIQDCWRPRVSPSLARLATNFKVIRKAPRSASILYIAAPHRLCACPKSEALGSTMQNSKQTSKHTSKATHS